MSSTFSCYNIARTGVYVSQRALEVIGHNLSNADTVGYVRQQAMLADSESQIYSGKQVGTGVSVSEIRQIRSIFLDNTYRQENSTKNYWDNIQNTVEDIEAVLNSLSESSGLGETIEDFFSGWEELAKEPENETAREAVVEYGNSFAEVINEIENQLNQIQDSLNEQIISMVDDINSIADRLAELNHIIVKNEINGQNANDYRDEMNYLLDQLSGYSEVEVTETESGMVNVSTGGRSIVNGNNSYHMSCIDEDPNGSFVTIIWENSGLEVKLTDGKLLSLIDARGDGEAGSLTETADVDYDSEVYSFSTSTDIKNLIPNLRKGLNILVSLMTRKVNAIHESGTDLNGDDGVSFFVKIDESLPFEAGNIKVNPILDDSNKIAASKTGAAGDGDIANEIVDFRDSDFFKSDSLEMSIDDFYIALADWIGTVGQEADSYVENQSSLVELADNNRLSLSAVSMEEELTNLIKFQHSYTASARVMTTIDSMVDKIINGTGIVGR